MGNGTFIENVGKTLAYWIVRLDRGPQWAAAALPAWPPQSTGQPAPVARSGAGREVLVMDGADLLRAIAAAEPGDHITVGPGRYLFDGRKSINVTRPGTADAPIVVRGATPGAVQFEFQMEEGFHLQAPYWQFEDLAIRGVCKLDSDCEHAFHIVGAAKHLVLRRLRLEDFNAHLKINGVRGQFPDGGQLLDSVLSNGHARDTANPVTPVDMVGANDWRIEGNLIADFIKLSGDRTSYGAFAKGAGRNNRLLRNVVLCEHRLREPRGKRVGLSLGGGGTSPAACRDQKCVVEQEAGLVEGNLIAQCSDDGIYLNAAAQSVVRNNTLIDTAGINARFAETSTEVSTNLVDGSIQARGQAILREYDNRSGSNALAMLGIHTQRGLFKDVSALDLRWSGDGAPRADSAPGLDLCGGTGPRRHLGASDDYTRCLAPTGSGSATVRTP